MMMNMMTGAVAINGGVGVMEIRQPQMVEKAVQDAGHIACLLYTSPSPRDVEESRMPSSA